MKQIKQFTQKRVTDLKKSIVGTPSATYLDSFMQANHGSNDVLLVQMAKQYGYELALDDVNEEVDKILNDKKRNLFSYETKQPLLSTDTIEDVFTIIAKNPKNLTRKECAILMYNTIKNQFNN